MQPTPSNIETNLPRAVLAQKARVDARLAERAAARSAAANPTPAQPDGAAAAATPGAEPAPQPSAANPVPIAAPAAPPSTPSADARENDPVYWRERFRVMQGINDKLREDHRDALQEANRQLGELRTRMQELEQQAAARPAAGNDKIDLSLFFKPDVIERFGEDQCEAMASAAIKAASDQAQRVIDAEVKPLKDKAKADKDREIQDAESKFWAALSQAVPTWEDVNADPDWLSWLNERDDDGETRQKRLDRHRAVRNAQGVANVFRDYLKTKQPAAQPPVAAPRGAGGGSGDMPQAAPGKGYPSREEIKEFHKRAATIRNPRDPRYVTDKERAEFDARMRLAKPQ